MSAPNSSITIYRCNLNPNGLFTCDFSNGSTSQSGVTSSGAARDSYFSGPDGTLATSVYTGSNYTFIRKDMTINVATNADTLNAAGANYCRFINPTYSGRWFYAFITKIEYVAEQTTKIHIKTDVFTTYFDVITRNETLVEREHVYNDTVFKHTLEEPTPHFEQFMRQLGSKKWDGSTQDKLGDNFYPIIFTSNGGWDHSEPEIWVSPRLSYFGHTPVPGVMATNIGQPYPEWGDLSSWANKSRVKVLWSTYFPVDGVGVGEHLDEDVNGDYPAGNKNYFCHTINDETDIEIQNPYNSIMLYGSGEDGHTVRNNKLNCFPYSAIEMNDYWDQSVILKPELMRGNHFYIHYELCDTPSITMYYPTYESDGQGSYMNKIALSDFPMYSYDIDYYTQYVALHKNQLNVQDTKDAWNATKSVLNLPTAFAKGATGDISGGVDSVMDGLWGVFDRQAMLSDMKLRPPQTFFKSTGSSRIGTDTFGFRINHYYPTKEYAEILDDFFDKYGYNVTETKAPCWNTRAGYNFVKTNGANLGGIIPIEDKEKLNQLFDAGITIWHSAANYGKYDISNLAPIH